MGPNICSESDQRDATAGHGSVGISVNCYWEFRASQSHRAGPHGLPLFKKRLSHNLQGQRLFTVQMRNGAGSGGVDL